MYLSVDLGSTQFKAAVFDSSLRRCGEGAAAVPYAFASGGHVEFAPEDAVVAFCRATGDAVADAGCAAEALRALAIDSQAQTFTVADAGGTPKTPFLSWQDTRCLGSPSVEALRQELDDFADHCSFCDFLPVLQVCQVRHLRDTRPDLFAPTDRILHLPSYLYQRLTGEAAVDDNLAAMSGFYSLAARDWWGKALAACRLTREQLPPLRHFGETVGRTRKGEALGLPAGIPVIAAGNDQTAGGYGAALHANGAVLLTLGTAHVVYATLPSLPPPAPGVVRGPYPGRMAYTLGVDTVGGNLINWAKTLLAECPTDAAFFAQVAASEPGCHGARFVAETGRHEMRWEGLGLHVTPGDMARALVETLCASLARVLERTVADWRTRPLLVAGGGSRSPVYVELLSRALGKEVEPTEADPLLGGARVALDATR